VIYKDNLKLKELDEENMRLYTGGEMMNDHPYGQIPYKSSLSHAFDRKLEYDWNTFW